MPFRPKQFKPPQWRPPPIKIADPYYSSKPWRELRAARLEMDNYKCAVASCSNRAIIADHIVSRLAGGADSIANLRSLCRLHDNQMRERSDGTRKEIENDMANFR
jgi:5-methylcytosine-specific restriction endonuclease McrA